jgi:hypothetical protein
MSGRADRAARRAARLFGGRFDQAFESQRPRWMAVLGSIMPMYDIPKLFPRALARYRAKMAAPNAKYKRYSEKVLARKAKAVARQVRA